MVPNVDMFCARMELVVHSECDSALIVAHERSGDSDGRTNFTEEVA